MKIFEEKKNKGVACPLVPLSTRRQKLEEIQSLPSEPPQREGDNLNRENPQAEILGRGGRMEPVAEGSYPFLRGFKNPLLPL
jgi:hypothetical protein